MMSEDKHTLRSGKTMKLGQPGTKQWISRFGEKLVYVRYKHDFQRKMKLETVELIVEAAPWDLDKDRIPANKRIGIRVKYGEVQMGKMVRAAGGKWNPKRKLWELPYRQAIALGLENRIVME